MTALSRFLLVLSVGVGLSGTALAAAKDDPAAALAKLTAGRVAGPPQQCIDLVQSYNTQVIDKQTIAYRVGNTWYVNQLRSGANLLDSRDILVTRTFGSQLCALDSIRLVDRYSGIPGGFVILGPFIPYKPKPKQP